jgi:hypothetical protein
MRFPLDLEPGNHLMTEDRRMHRVIDKPIASGDWVGVVVRDAGETQSRKLWLRRNMKVLTRTAEEQLDLVKQEFGFDYVPRP